MLRPAPKIKPLTVALRLTAFPFPRPNSCPFVQFVSLPQARRLQPRPSAFAKATARQAAFAKATARQAAFALGYGATGLRPSALHYRAEFLSQSPNLSRRSPTKAEVLKLLQRTAHALQSSF